VEIPPSADLPQRLRTAAPHIVDAINVFHNCGKRKLTLDSSKRRERILRVYDS
jgi:hypothetical protein